jgi:hypothetical protein
MGAGGIFLSGVGSRFFERGASKKCTYIFRLKPFGKHSR